MTQMDILSDLQAAKQALSGSHEVSTFGDVDDTSPIASGTWSFPRHLLPLPSLHGVAAAAAESGRVAAGNPGDFAAVLQHGLNLQECASRLDVAQAADQLLLLHRACEVYGRANELQDGRTAVVLFNWAVALSDISRLTQAASSPSSGGGTPEKGYGAGSPPGEVVEFLSAAAMKYSAALTIDPNNPQALNNLGLVLQDLAVLSPPQQRAALVPAAVARFRAALRMQPDAKLTSRFCYNLGTVLYSHACNLQERLGIGASPRGGSVAPPPAVAAGVSVSAAEQQVREAFTNAAQYIMLAHALQPGVKVYEDSLAAVQRILPLPYLRAGPLLVAAPGTEGTPAEEWLPAWFALDGQALQSVRPPAGEAGRVPGAVLNVVIDLEDVVDAQVCWDASLPEGVGLWLGLKSKSGGMFLVAADRNEAECWVDALRLVSLLHKSDGAERLQTALIRRRQRQVTAVRRCTPEQ